MRYSLSALCLFLCVGWASSGFGKVATASGTPLNDLVSLIPDSALGAVVVNQLGNADAKWRQVARHLRLPLPGLLDALRDAGVKEGLDSNGCGALVLVAESTPGSPPVLMAFLPITDYKKFVGQAGSGLADAGISPLSLAGMPLLVRHLGAYAVLAQESHRDVLEKITPAKETTPADITLWRTSLAKHAVSLVVTRAGIQAVVPQLRTRFKGVENGLGSLLSAQWQQQVLHAMERDLRSICLGLSWSQARGLWLVGHARFVAGSPTADALMRISMDTADPFELLPAGAFIYALGGRMPPDIGRDAAYSAIAPILALLDASGGKPQLAPLADTVRKLSGGVRNFALLLGAAKAGDNVYFHHTNFLEVFQVDDARAFLNGQEKLVGQIAGLNAGQTKPWTFTTKRVDIDGLRALEISFKTISSPEIEALLLSQYRKEHPDWTGTALGPAEAFEARFGLRGEPSIWFVTVDERTVVAGTFRQDLLRQGIKVVTKSAPSLATAPELADLVKLMRGKALWRGCWSPHGTVASARQILPGVLPKDAPPLPEFSSNLPVGFLVMGDPSDLGFAVAVPTEVVKSAGMFQEALHNHRTAAEGRKQPQGEQSFPPRTVPASKARSGA